MLSGQVVSAEILMASEHGCPIEMHRIEIEKCDEMYDKDCTGKAFMPFHRAHYDSRTGQSPNSPREQVRTHIHSLIFNFPGLVVKVTSDIAPPSMNRSHYSASLFIFFFIHH